MKQITKTEEKKLLAELGRLGKDSFILKYGKESLNYTLKPGTNHKDKVAPNWGYLSLLEELIDVKHRLATLENKLGVVKKHIIPQSKGKDLIVGVVSTYTGISIDLLLTGSNIKGSNQHNITLARALCYKFIQSYYPVTLSDLGRYFNGRSHATIKSGLETLDDLLETDSTVRNLHESITNHLNKRLYE